MGDRTERASVVVRPVGDGRAELIDVHGDVWEFAVDDGTEDLRSVPCTVIRDEMVDGLLHVLIETDVPTIDGVSRFRVLRALVP